MSDLSSEQRRAVETVRGPVVVHAGPGSGKTRVVTHRIAAQVAAGMAPAGIAAVTFTDRAAGELLARLRRLGVPTGSGGVRASTFHSAALRQVGAFWPRVRDGATLDVLPSKLPLLVPIARRSRRDATALAEEVEWVKAHGACLPGVADDPDLPAPLAALDLDGPAPRWRLLPDRYAAARPGEDAAALADVLDRYEAAKAARGRVDFEDLLAVARALLATEPAIATAVRRRLTHFTVDEFQDVNRLQWDLLSAWLGGRDDVCVVGDPDQAIYGFSGASPRYLDALRARFPHATVVTLADNHRSTQPILDLATGILAGRRTLRAVRGGGPAPRLVEHTTEEDERAAVVARCRELAADGVAYDEMALLYRFNAQSEAWEEAFADAGVPYRVRGDEAFFGRRHVARALTVLERAVAAGASEPPDDDPRVLLDGAAPARPRLDRLVERLLRDKLSWSPQQPAGERARERWDDLRLLVDLAREQAEADEQATLSGFVADLRRRAAADDQPAGGVNMLTLHRAKGLEFDAVFCVSVEEGRVPSRYAVDDDAALGRSQRHPDSAVAEERRLLYVGVTRARTHLEVSWVRRGAKRPSRFLPRRPVAAARPLDSRRDRPRDRTGDAAADELFERLRAWRRSTALDQGVPAYVVFPDSTLRDIASRRPASRAALRAIGGVGPAKLDRYGDAVLALVARAEDTSGRPAAARET